MRFGAGFGTIGPDAGYAMSLVKARELDLADGELRLNTSAALTAIASARAALFGRAPTAQDVDLAVVLLGLDPDTPEQLRAELAPKRLEWFAAAAHHANKLFPFIASLDEAVLRLTADEARARMAQGSALITH